MSISLHGNSLSVMALDDLNEAHSPKKPTLLDWIDLTKPKIALHVVFAAMAAYILASSQQVDWLKALYVTLGVALTSACGGVLNQVWEHRFDAVMPRTTERAIPTGLISATVAFFYGIVLGIIGFVLLYFTVNPLTALLSLSTVLLYILVYTPLKRVSKYNTLMGTIPGALPALGGWTAVQPELSAQAFLLFGILLLWQMPHFLALAWMYKEDYAIGGFQMLPVVEPDGQSTKNQSLSFTVLLFGLSIMPFYYQLSGCLYLGGALLLGIFFLYRAWQFYQDATHKTAKNMLLASVIYIPMLLLIIIADKFLHLFF